MRLKLFLLPLAAAVMLAGCDQAPGAGDPSARAPRISALQVAPRLVGMAPNQTSIQIPLDISVTVTDPDNDVAEVRYLVVSQFGQVLLEGRFPGFGIGQYRLERSLTVSRAQAGLYTVLVTASDRQGLVSNQARGLLDIRAAASGPPTIVEIDAPDTFTPPGRLVLVAVVSDPVGVGNIARVEVTAPTGAVFRMFDDGASSGDEVAGDGRFTASFDVDQASPGPQTFRFRATNRDGLASETVSHTITILP